MAWADLPTSLRQPDPAEALTRPDDGLAVVAGGVVTASAALWWRERVVAEGAVGRIGHARWTSPDAGAALLADAARVLRERGMSRAVGPLDGSTWFGYRVVTESDGSPPFALEPAPDPAIAHAFERAGFAPVAHYLSSRVPTLPDESTSAASALAHLGRQSVTVRPLDAADAERDLEALHGLLLRAFAGNPFYAPLDLGRFLALYQPLVARVDPELVLIAEIGGEPVGVVLAMPDVAQAARGKPIDTVIVKTLAVDPERRGQRIGGALVRIVQERARRRGHRSAIHALMHADNASTRISAHLGTPFRRYALLGLDLEAR